jgi:hypothetical protein
VVVAAGGRIFASDILAIIAGTTGKPVCRLIQQSAQSLTDNTEAALTFGAGSEAVDSHGFHDTSVNPSRITPNKAGWYTLRGILTVPALATYASIQVAIRKNGANIPSVIREGPNATASSRSVQVAILEQANGTTDYFEVAGYQDNTANSAQNTPSTGGSFSCVFECVFERNP